MGMMGASLGAALRRSPEPPRITGVVRSEKSRTWIQKENLADEVLALPSYDPESLDLRQFDLVVLGMPIQANGHLMESIYSAYSGFGTGGTSGFPLITDMSSTRRYLEEVASRCSNLPFIGSHPMCGSADAGPTAYRDDLFVDRLVILIQSSLRKNESREDFEKLGQFWTSVGAKISQMNESDHDLVLAYLSHAPHLVSSLLATVTASRKEVRRINAESPMPITGGGLRDMLRIAGSNPEMWSDILITNRAYIVESLKDLRKGLDDLIETVDSESMDWWSDWQNQSRKYRNEICGYPDD